MSKKAEYMQPFKEGGILPQVVRQVSEAYDAGRNDALSNLANEQEAFEQYASRDGKNPEAIEKHGTNFAYTRTNAARVVWLACLEWVRGES